MVITFGYATIKYEVERKMWQIFHGNYNTFRLDSNEFLMTEHFFFQRLKSSFIPYLIMCAK